jgi:cytochrome P450
MYPFKTLMGVLFHKLHMRFFSSWHLLFPRLFSVTLTSQHRCLRRNVNRIRNALLKLIELKKANGGDGDDLLSILTATDGFKENPGLIIDEIFTMFFAGNKTI